ncbi:viroplasmin family protein [Parabacteroides sp. OttesenSCG-928-K15]|nr:viroplasmin family protein [Parabacteroides sp. OttesenSCG-928-K15]
MSKSKFYVVWNGVNPGVYDNWTDTKLQIEGFAGAKYKSFATQAEAEEAYQNGYFEYLKKASSPKAVKKISFESAAEGSNVPDWNSLSVDAACSGNPGDMEYRGVYTATGQELFRIGPMKKGTNNVGEFLALVHGLALLHQKNSELPIYTDSVNAMKWVKNKKAKTLLERLPENEQIFNLIERAENWLKSHTYKNRILKWNTAEWGEIPADFGRKK